MSQPIRLKAMEIVEAEEHSKGWSPHALGIAALEKEHGCDLISTSPTGEEHVVEVKGWGEPFVGSKGQFRYTQDIRASQMKAAERLVPYGFAGS